MSNENGRPSPQLLAPIDGGYLRRDAASAFNAMCRAADAQLGIAVAPLGLLSTYRTYEQQAYLWERFRAVIPHVVARPGTSSHGLGIAVDLASVEGRWAVDQIGSQFGWSKSSSDARGSWSHIRYRPGPPEDAADWADEWPVMPPWPDWQAQISDAIETGDPLVAPRGHYDPRRVEKNRS